MSIVVVGGFWYGEVIVFCVWDVKVECDDVGIVKMVCFDVVCGVVCMS